MFITLEGMEGAGKSTLAKGIAQQLADMGRSSLITREPGGCALGKTLRSMLLDTRSTVCPHAELFLFLADRAQHVHQIIRPALAAGDVVICDRFADSTIVYQGYGRGFDVPLLQRLNHLAIDGLWPDVTLILDVPPHTGLARAHSRNAAASLTSAEGRFEAEDLIPHPHPRRISGLGQSARRTLCRAGRHPFTGSAVAGNHGDTATTYAVEERRIASIKRVCMKSDE